MKKNSLIKTNRFFIRLISLSFLFFTALCLASCNLEDNTDELIIQKWTQMNSYFEKVYYKQLNRIPDHLATKEAYSRISDFYNIMADQEKKFGSAVSYLYSSNKEHISKIIETSGNVRDVLCTIYEKDEVLSNDEFQHLATQLHIFMYMLSDEMVILEYNWSKTFKDSIFSFIKYFLIFITFIGIFTITLLILIVIESKHKDSKLQESSNYLRYTLMAQEEERNRISRELHDTIAQDMRYILSLTGKLPSSEEQQQILDRQKECISEIRNLCYNMAPPDIENKDLATSLETLCGKFMNDSKIETRLTITDDVSFASFDNEKMLNIYRIVQEALSNIEKHTDATEATILFRNTRVTNQDGESEKMLLLIISDDGKGIESDLLAKINNEQATFTLKGHFGIRSIKERVHFLGGKITYASYPNCGTRVQIHLPC